MKAQFVFIVSALLAASTGFCFGQSNPIGELEARLEKEPENTAILLTLGKHYHDLGGSSGRKEDVKRAERHLAALLELEPGNNVAMVYYGSVLTMKARHATFPWSKMRFMNIGFARMDKAVHREPDSHEIRLIRGINSTRVPGRFHRLALALEDFAHIEALSAKCVFTATERVGLPFHLHHGLSLEKRGKAAAARKQYLRTIEIDTASTYAVQARERLEQMEE